MELDANEQRDGMRWLFIAGAIAIVLSFALKTVDDRLTNSDYDERLGATLRELRTAQASVSTGVRDERLRHPALVTSKGE